MQHILSACTRPYAARFCCFKLNSSSALTAVPPQLTLQKVSCKYMKPNIHCYVAQALNFFPSSPLWLPTLPPLFRSSFSIIRVPRCSQSPSFSLFFSLTLFFSLFLSHSLFLSLSLFFSLNFSLSLFLSGFSLSFLSLFRSLFLSVCPPASPCSLTPPLYNAVRSSRHWVTAVGGSLL